MQQNQNILIVEDEQALAEVLSETLKEEGYEVTVAFNGEEGLQKALDQHPQLILLDILMPKMDGVAMMKALRQGQTPPISNVIFFTNLNQLDKIADAIKEGAAGYIIKAEASLETILNKVNDFFAKQETK